MTRTQPAKSFSGTPLALGLCLALLFSTSLRLPAQVPPSTNDLVEILKQSPVAEAPFEGSFWLESQVLSPRGSAPLPCAPVDLINAGAPVYALADATGCFLVDDTQVSVSSDAQSFRAGGMTMSTMDSLQNQPQGTLVPLSDVPAGAGFFSMANPLWAPMPVIPDTNLSVYLETNGFFVDDLNYTYPTNSQPDTPGPSPSYPSNALWLSITNVGAEFCTVILHSTTNGGLYTIFSQTALPSESQVELLALAPTTPWMVERHITGAAGQDWTSLQVPVLSRQTLFFWAFVELD